MGFATTGGTARAAHCMASVDENRAISFESGADKSAVGTDDEFAIDKGGLLFVVAPTRVGDSDAAQAAAVANSYKQARAASSIIPTASAGNDADAEGADDESDSMVCNNIAAVRDCGLDADSSGALEIEAHETASIVDSGLATLANVCSTSSPPRNRCQRLST